MREFLVKWQTEKSSGSRVVEAEQQNDALMIVANELCKKEGDGEHAIPGTFYVSPVSPM